jgi:hypothetical protein
MIISSMGKFLFGYDQFVEARAVSVVELYKVVCNWVYKVVNRVLRRVVSSVAHCRPLCTPNTLYTSL